MKLESLNIRWVSYPTPEHWEGWIQYKDDDNKSKIELSLTAEQVESIFPIIADKMVEISRKAAIVIREEIISQQEETEEPE